MEDEGTDQNGDEVNRSNTFNSPAAVPKRQEKTQEDNSEAH